MPDVTLPTYIHEQLEKALDVLARCDCDDAATRAEALYAQWYAPARPSFRVPAGCPPNLTEMLRAAHPGFTDWEERWRVESVGSRGQVVVRRDGELRLLDRSDYASVTRRGLLPRPGDTVSVTGRRDHVEDDGWWRTGGRAWSWTRSASGLIRLYIQRDVVGVPALVAAVTRLLAAEREPWLLKCATDPAQYARPDAIVAYLARSTAERRAGELAELGLVGEGQVHGRGPALTFPVAPGLAASFDPGGNESFGAHRCGLIAEASADGVEAVVDRFLSEGIDPVRPWARVDDASLPWER